MNVNSGAVDRVTFIGNYNANPKLSADEKTLVMVHRQQGYTNFQIAARDLQRGNLRVLSNTTLDDSPTVAPNGTMLIYATRQQDRGVLMLVSINGRVRIPLLPLRAMCASLPGPLPELTVANGLQTYTLGSLELHDGNAEIRQICCAGSGHGCGCGLLLQGRRCFR